MIQPRVPPPRSGPLPPPPSAAPARPGGGEPSGAGAAVLLVLLGAWTALLAVVAQFGAWVYDQGFDPMREQALSWLVALLGPAVLAGVPALLVWRFARHPRARAVARCWTLAAGVVLVLSPARLLPSTDSDLATLVLAAGAAALALLVSRIPAWRVPRTSGDGGTYVPAVAGLLTLLPWVWLGALGGVVDSVLTALLAVALGWLAAVLLAPLWRDLAGWSRAAFGWFGGAAGGVALALLAAAAAPRVSVMLLAACLPPVAFVCAAASYPRARRMPTAAGVATAAFGPLAFVDPDEVTILLGGGVDGIVAFTLAATGLGMLAGLVGSGALAGLARFLRRRTVAGGVTVLALIAAAALYAAAGQQGLHGDRLFVVLRQQASLAGISASDPLDERRTAVYDRLVIHADRTQWSLRHALDELGISYTPYYLVNAIEVDAGDELRPWLAARSDVAEVLRSPRLRPIPDLPPVTTGNLPPPTELPWNLAMVRADQVWQRFHVRGQGVVVGQSDSGVDGTHPALASSYRGRGGSDDYNWLDPWYGSESPHDWGGHGTHTLGTAVGRGVGVAPGARWIGCVNLGRNLGDPALYLTCLQFMLAPYPQRGDPFRDGDPASAADVLNNSWGCPPIEGCDANVLRPAVRALTVAGIFVVASAGNSGPACGSISDPPSLYADAFSVGAVDAAGHVVPFSSRGPVTVDGSDRSKPDIAAPGAEVLSSLPGGTYGELSGTSMAGPHVVGTVALMWSANPRLKGDVARTARLLRRTARPAPASPGEPACGGERYDVGAGIVDAYAAVRAAMRVR